MFMKVYMNCVPFIEVRRVSRGAYRGGGEETGILLRLAGHVFV